MEWGYTKNVKRAEVQHILRESQSRESAGKQSSFTLRRARLPTQPAGAAPPFPATDDTVSGSRQIACRTPPPAHIPAALPPNGRWVISEKILFHVDALVKGSFEAGRWRFNGNDALIFSSPAQQAECNRLHGFLNSLADGSAAAAASDFVRAGSHWRHAFLAVEGLVVQGAYHGIVPSLVFKINDLNRQGLSDVAIVLKTHIARCCGKAEMKETPDATIYLELGRLDMADMEDVEERIMQRFSELFMLYLGPRCYSSFVMAMDRARRRLTHQPWTTFADFVPPLEDLDAQFGHTDRRSLDVLALRAEILSERGGFEDQVEAEAAAIVERAMALQGENDGWQRLYNFVRGWFFLGQAQFRMGKREDALVSLHTALGVAEEFRMIDESDIFEPERAVLAGYLETLQLAEPLVDFLGTAHDGKAAGAH